MTTDDSGGTGGEGSPSARLSLLLSELAKRFPDAAPSYLSDPPEPKYLAAIDALTKERDEARRERDVFRDKLNPRSVTIATLLSLARDIELCNEGDHNFLRIAADAVEKWMPNKDKK